MIPTEINTIDDVINALEQIVIESEIENDPLGYFAVLYQKVTIKVKEGIENNYFDDVLRMEQLDVVFAKKYIDAYYNWKQNKAVSLSWNKTFLISNNYWPIVFQHLLLGMNAHINLDLGVAAAEISAGKNIEDLQADFYRINEILSSLVNDVQNNLSFIWPPLGKIMKKTGNLDNLLVNFSMELARDGAWKFAQNLASFTLDEQPAEIAKRDEKIVQKAELITNPGTGIKFLFFFIRLGELGNVSEKIRKFKAGTDNIVSG